MKSEKNWNTTHAVRRRNLIKKNKRGDNKQKNTRARNRREGECCIYKREKKKKFYLQFFQKREKTLNCEANRNKRRKSLWRMKTNHVQLSCILYEFSIEGYF